jgi:hypothetical protein
MKVEVLSGEEFLRIIWFIGEFLLLYIVIVLAVWSSWQISLGKNPIRELGIKHGETWHFQFVLFRLALILITPIWYSIIAVIALAILLTVVLAAWKFVLWAWS